MDNSREPEGIDANIGIMASTQKQPMKRVITAARKEQNRLAQRAYRKKQKEQKRLQTQPATSCLRRLEPRPDNAEALSVSSAPSGSRRGTRSRGSRQTVDQSRSYQMDTEALVISAPGVEDLPVVDSQIAPNQVAPSSASEGDIFDVLPALITTASFDERDVYPQALINIALGTSGSLEENSTTVFRACLSNAFCIGLDIAELMYCQRPCMSPFYRPTARMDEDPAMLLAVSSHESLPASLKPTLAQIFIPHHASLDLIPLPRLRDRAILMCAALPHTFSLWEMKLDIYTRNALVCHSRSTSDGSISQPWDRRSWRAAPWFINKWKMVIDTDEVKASLSMPGLPGLWM
ncbi:hypothetical protein NUW58_g274 [Xylaria curta]|uniref:Uncharacterized protein n=1 Tax=Xylaria curta TaxID=42375 RepID=A0ACC1PPX6_9PEZI|nr:hypothetical protein NUW58_g274 [Xylaria curta]